jgi:hypothetical protein
VQLRIFRDVEAIGRICSNKTVENKNSQKIKIFIQSRLCSMFIGCVDCVSHGLLPSTLILLVIARHRR